MVSDDLGRVLITGAAGFIGFEVTRVALDQGFTVTALDGLLDGLYPSQEKRERWARLQEVPELSLIEDDLRTMSWEKYPQEFDYVINLAAMPGLALSWTEFELYRSCNFDSVKNLLDAAKNWPLKKFLQISTSSVYGLNAVGDETKELEPVSPYGVTKLAAEQLVFAYFRTYGLPGSILRYFSVYGPGQRPDMAYRKFIDSALSNQPITLYGDGSQSRTNTYVMDIAHATVNALEGAQPGEAYNLCGNEETTIAAAVSFILEATKSSSPIDYKPRIPGDQDRTAGDSSKARKHFGFDPSTSLHEGLAEHISSLQNR